MKLQIIFLLIILSLATRLPTATAAESGADTLQRFTGAREAGMGEAFSTVSDDISACQFNPAMLGTLSQPQGSVSESLGFASDYLSAVSVGYPTRFGNFLAAINYYDTGSEKLYASDGSIVDLHLQQDFLGAISYGKQLGIIGFGGTLKYLSSDLAEYKTASSYAFDIGGALILGSPDVSLGVSLRNIGQGLKFVSERDPLPRELRTGISYAFNLGNDNSKILLSADVPYLIVDKTTQENLGAEWCINKAFSLRIGEHFNSDVQSLTFGLGLKTRTFSFDYSYGAAGPLNSINNVSIGYRWGAQPTVLARNKPIEKADDSLSDDVNSLINNLHSKDWQKRIVAADKLGEIREKKGVKSLIETLNDENENVAGSAAKSLGLIGDSAAFQPLVDSLSDASPYVKISAIKGLVNLGDNRAIAPLKKTLRDENPEVRQAASEALKTLSE